MMLLTILRFESWLRKQEKRPILTASPSDNVEFQELTAMSSHSKPNPVKDVFRDVTIGKLLLSSWRVFVAVLRTQGPKAALRVIPIIWMIIKAVRGFAEFHQL